MDISCFKAYDIRGHVPKELDADLAWRIGRAYVEEIQPGKVVVGYDARLESPMLAQALITGLMEAGAEVIDIGLCGTEEVYFHTFHRQSQGVNGGIMITASHNPKGYNGMKLVREGARPVSSDSGLLGIRERVAAYPATLPPTPLSGRCMQDYDKTPYIEHLLSYIDRPSLKPLKIVADPGHGTAGPILRQLAKHLPFEFIFIRDQPDGHFPDGAPNPLLPAMRTVTARAVLAHHADLGLAWDGDFDRCFFFDHTGRFIEGYYLVGLLAEIMLTKHPGGTIIHDPRLIWNTIEQVRKAGGHPLQNKTGHAFIKERMRQEKAIYGGEMSSHHYFRDFAYCDSGMLPWLLVTELISKTATSLAELVDARMQAYPCSGELNYTVHDVTAVMERVLDYYASLHPAIDRTDGLSLEFSTWRFNLRASNTEPLLRLNIETRGDAAALAHHIAELEKLIQGSA